MAILNENTIFTEEVLEREILLDVQDAYKYYNEGQENEVQVLKGINFSIPAGQMVAIMGPSGCGKTTLLNLMGGLDSITKGSISIDDASIVSMDDKQLTNFRRDNIGYIFQLFNLFEDQTALQNVTLPLYLQGISSSDAEFEGRTLLLEVGLGDRVNDLPRQLSGGEQQKIAIARALITKPKLILADEPTGDLDRSTSDDIMALFRRLQKENPDTSVVIVTHSEHIAKQCDRIIQIEKGVIDRDELINHLKEEEL